MIYPVYKHMGIPPETLDTKPRDFVLNWIRNPFSVLDIVIAYLKSLHNDLQQLNNTPAVCLCLRLLDNDYNTSINIVKTKIPSVEEGDITELAIKIVQKLKVYPQASYKTIVKYFSKYCIFRYCRFIRDFNLFITELPQEKSYTEDLPDFYMFKQLYSNNYELYLLLRILHIEREEIDHSLYKPKVAVYARRKICQRISSIEETY